MTDRNEVESLLLTAKWIEFVSIYALVSDAARRQFAAKQGVSINDTFSHLGVLNRG